MRRTLRNEGNMAARAKGSRSKLKPLPYNGEAMRKWSLYTSRQKEAILDEFRRRLPDDYYCKSTFFRFPQEKLIEGERHDSAIERMAIEADGRYQAILFPVTE